MSKPSKPSSPVVVPRQSTRLAVAAATALVGFALTGTPALALGGGAQLETCPTWGELHTIGGWAVAIAVLFVATFAAANGLVALWRSSPRQAGLTVLACASIVTFVVAWAATASPILIAPDPDLPGGSSASVRFE